MRFLNNIPRGLIVFLSALAVVIVLALGYRFLASGVNSSANGTGGTNGFFSALFPFGSSAAPASGTAAETATSSSENNGPVPLLREVSSAPVAGAWFAAGAASTSASVIRYMDRASGHIQETPANSLTETRISNTTIPGIEELYAVGPKALIVRYLGLNREIHNEYGTISATSSQSFDMTPLKPFDRVAADQNGNVLTVTIQNSGSQVGLSKPDGTKAQLLLTSPISSWVPLVGGGRTFLEAAPSAYAAGYLYELKQGALSLIVGGSPGLMTRISPSGKYAAVSANTAQGFALEVVDTTTGVTLPTPIKTLAEKCAWIPDHEPLMFCAAPLNPKKAFYPDDWLLGRVSFDDQAWIVNPEKNSVFFIGDLADTTGVRMDATHVAVDNTGSYALFVNKKDLSLWSLNIGNAVFRAESL